MNPFLPFPGPLALLEHNIEPHPGQPATQYHLVQQWCYIGTYPTLESLRGTLKKTGESVFDRDAYRLLSNALRRGRVEVLNAIDGQVIDNPLLGLRR